jgi:hypothetical protein
LQKAIAGNEGTAQQLAGTLMTLMVWWMDHHYPLGADEMEKQFQRLIAGLS